MIVAIILTPNISGVSLAPVYKKSPLMPGLPARIVMDQKAQMAAPIAITMHLTRPTVSLIKALHNKLLKESNFIK